MQLIARRSPSPGTNATNGRGIAAGLSPAGRGATHWMVILPRPLGGEAGPVSFRGRVRGNPLPQLHRSGCEIATRVDSAAVIGR